MLGVVDGKESGKVPGPRKLEPERGEADPGGASGGQGPQRSPQVTPEFREAAIQKRPWFSSRQGTGLMTALTGREGTGVGRATPRGPEGPVGTCAGTALGKCQEGGVQLWLEALLPLRTGSEEAESAPPWPRPAPPRCGPCSNTLTGSCLVWRGRSFAQGHLCLQAGHCTHPGWGSRWGLGLRGAARG